MQTTAPFITVFDLPSILFTSEFRESCTSGFMRPAVSACMVPTNGFLVQQRFPSWRMLSIISELYAPMERIDTIFPTIHGIMKFVQTCGARGNSWKWQRNLSAIVDSHKTKQSLLWTESSLENDLRVQTGQSAPVSFG